MGHHLPITEKYPQNNVMFNAELPIDRVIDDVDDSGAVSYVGITNIRGGATSAAIWRIYRAKKVGYVTYIGWVNDAQFDQVWDNRASLTYSQGGV